METKQYHRSMVISLIGVFDLHPLLIMVVVIAMQFVHERVTAR